MFRLDIVILLIGLHDHLEEGVFSMPSSSGNSEETSPVRILSPVETPLETRLSDYSSYGGSSRNFRTSSALEHVLIPRLSDFSAFNEGSSHDLHYPVGVSPPISVSATPPMADEIELVAINISPDVQLQKISIRMDHILHLEKPKLPFEVDARDPKKFHRLSIETDEHYEELVAYIAKNREKYAESIRSISIICNGQNYKAVKTFELRTVREVAEDANRRGYFLNINVLKNMLNPDKVEEHLKILGVEAVATEPGFIGNMRQYWRRNKISTRRKKLTLKFMYEDLPVETFVLDVIGI